MTHIKKSLIYISLALAALYTLSGFAVNKLQPATDTQLQKILINFTQYAEQTRKAWQIPGMAIAIVKGNQIIYKKGFGVRNMKGEPVTPETIFNVASLTKSFTAALLAKQIEEGKYTWDTKVQQLYPEFKLYDSKATQEFTVKDLIAHDSGLSARALQFLPYFGYDQDYQIHALRFIKPEAPFRKKFAYQNIFLGVAEKIIEKYSGISYADNLHKQLFKPLNMHDSYVWTEDLSKQDNVAQPNFYYRGKVIAIPNNWLYWETGAIASLEATAGIKSSVIDIAKWLIFHINNGSMDGKQLIDAKDMNFMHASHTPIKITTHGEIKEAYGEGWFINTQENVPYTTIYHTGDYTGVKALMKYIPEAKIGIVILTNQLYNLAPEALANRFFAMCFHKPLKDWAKISLLKREQDEQKKLSESPKCSNTRTNDLEKYTGTYYNDVYGNLVVAKDVDHLSLTIGPKKVQWLLLQCQNNIFKASWSNPSKLDFPILLGKEEVVKFIFVKATNVIGKMQVNYLNADGGGVFVKK